jgi:hypothetical protein
LVLLGLAGCANFESVSGSATLIPTEQLPTVIAMTVQALIAQAQSETPEAPQIIPETMALTPTEVPDSTSTTTPEESNLAQPISHPQTTATSLPPIDIPYAEIQFISPGALSKVSSPIKLHAFLVPGDDGQARVELFGEDGRLMYRQLFVFSSPPGAQANLTADIDFEIQGVAETATLVISLDDSYGRVKERASEELILLSLGDSDINPPGDHLAPIVIQEPASKVLIQGDTLLVSGLIRTPSDQPLLVELVTSEGKVIGSRLAGIAAGVAGVHRLFAAEVSFSVESPTWVRVVVSERNRWGNGSAQLTSVEVLLAP